MNSSTPRWAKWLILALVVTFAGRVITHSLLISPTTDELVHLVAGYSYWRWHDFRLNPEHPPLVKWLAALPLLWLEPLPASVDLSSPLPVGGPGSLSQQELKKLWKQVAHKNSRQWEFSHEFVYGVRDETLERFDVPASRWIKPSERIERREFLSDADRLFFWGRLPLLAFGILICALVYSWTRQLLGWRAGLLALAFCAFDPNLVAHSTLVATDVAVTALALGTVYGLWSTARGGGWPSMVATIGCFSLAFTAKFSAVLLAPLVTLLALAAAVEAARAGELRRSARQLLVVGLCALGSIFALWACYGFRYSGMAEDQDRVPMRVDEKLHQAVAREAEFEPSVEGREFLGFADRALAWINRHRLLPEAYSFGLADARLQSRSRPAFLRGAHSERGFRSFFLWSFLLKTPLLSLVAIAASLVVVIPRLGWRNSLYVLLPVALFLSAAVTSNLNIGHRHILPVYPFLFVLAGGSVAAVVRRWSGNSVTGVGLAAALVVLGSTVVFVPLCRPSVALCRPLEYFNELAGGPENGYKSLVDSSLDWGQGLKDLKHWLERREISGPINLCYFGSADPRFYQIRYVRMPCDYAFAPPFRNRGRFPRPRRPGILAVSATHLQGHYGPEHLRQRFQALLQQAILIDRVGSSIFVYYLPK